MTRADSWQRAPEAVRDLARRNEDTETIQRERAASTDMASREMQLLYPEIGAASALAQPGGFRRAHLAERQAAVAGVGAVAYAETRLESKQPAVPLHVSGMLKDAFSPATPLSRATCSDAPSSATCRDCSRSLATHAPWRTLK